MRPTLRAQSCTKDKGGEGTQLEGTKTPRTPDNSWVSDTGDAVPTLMYGEDDRSKLWSKEWGIHKNEVSKGRNVHINMSY